MENISKKSKVNIIAGIELGSIPLASVASIYSDKKFVMIRKSKKNYGTSKPIEGKYRKNESVIIIDDVLTSGKSILNAKKILESQGLRPIAAIVVVDREEGGVEKLKKEMIDIFSLYRRADLLQ